MRYAHTSRVFQNTSLRQSLVTSNLDTIIPNLVGGNPSSSLCHSRVPPIGNCSPSDVDLIGAAPGPSSGAVHTTGALCTCVRIHQPEECHLMRLERSFQQFRTQMLELLSGRSGDTMRSSNSSELAMSEHHSNSRTRRRRELRRKKRQRQAVVELMQPDTTCRDLQRGSATRSLSESAVRSCERGPSKPPGTELRSYVSAINPHARGFSNASLINNSVPLNLPLIPFQPLTAKIAAFENPRTESQPLSFISYPGSPPLPPQIVKQLCAGWSNVFGHRWNDYDDVYNVSRLFQPDLGVTRRKVHSLPQFFNWTAGEGNDVGSSSGGSTWSEADSGEEITALHLNLSESVTLDDLSSAGSSIEVLDLPIEMHVPTAFDILMSVPPPAVGMAGPPTVHHPVDLNEVEINGVMCGYHIYETMDSAALVDAVKDEGSEDPIRKELEEELDEGKRSFWRRHFSEMCRKVFTSRDIDLRGAMEEVATFDNGKCLIVSEVDLGKRWHVTKNEDGDMLCVLEPIPVNNTNSPDQSNNGQAFGTDETRPSKVLVLSCFMKKRGLPFVDGGLYYHLKTANLNTGTAVSTHMKLCVKADKYLSQYRLSQYDGQLLLEVKLWTVLAAMLPLKSELHALRLLGKKRIFGDINKVANFKRAGHIKERRFFGLLPSRHHTLWHE